jgi:peptidoglycan/LPS O-acetylase OafA/YrhL
MSAKRFESLDGLRGVAAVSVAAYHFLSAYIPGVIPGQSAAIVWLSDTPLAVLYNGAFAVEIFFVLSGFVVSDSAAKRHMPVIFNLASRYVRLAIPVLGGTLFGWALLALWPHTDVDVVAATNPAWFVSFYPGPVPGIFFTLKDALLGVFITGRSLFDPPLWTMKLELIGSLSIYLLYGLIGPKYRVPVLIVVALLCAFALRRPAYAAFAIGALIREAAVSDRLRAGPAWPYLGFGIVVGAMMEGYAARVGIPALPGMLALGQPHQVWQVAAAAALLYALLKSAAFGALLSTKPARFLGTVSFGFYLVHVPLLRLLRPFAFAAEGHWAAMALLLMLFLIASIGVGFVFTLAVDRPTLRLIRRGRTLIQNRRLVFVDQP